MKQPVVLKSLIKESKDGEWGKGEPFDKSVEMVVIRGTDFDKVRDGSLVDVPTRHIPAHIAKRKTLQPNDIVFETAGGSKDRPTGRSVFVKEKLIASSELPITCASFSRFIRIEPDKADPKYIYWLLQGGYKNGQLRKYNTQHTGVARFQYTTFAENEELHLPCLCTQRKIAAILSAYDDLIENNTRRIRVLETMAQTLYREWFVNFRFPGHHRVVLVDSPLGKIPEGWEAKKLQDVSSYVNRGVSPKYNDESESIVINQKCIRDGKLNLSLARRHSSKVTKDKLIRLGDVLVNSTGVGTLGRVAQMYQHINDCTVDSHVTIVRPNEEVAIDYFGMALLELQQHFDSLGVGATGQTELGRSSIANTEFLLPPKEMQSMFAELAAPIRKKALLLESRNGSLRRTRDLLLPKLISGEVDVERLDVHTGAVVS